MARKKVNYINNKDFLAALIDHKQKVETAQAEGLEPPVPSDYIGKCIMQISTRLATKPNFSGYIFKEEMIFDGIENGIAAIKSFNPDKYDNPFAYFTTIIYYAFLRRIEKEKKQLYIKYKYSEQQLMLGDTYDGDHAVINLDTDHMEDFIRDYEEKLEEKKAKNKK